MMPDRKWRRMPHHVDPSSSSSRATGHKRERDSSDSNEGFGHHTYVKLFVGSVPRAITEEQVRPMFEEYGEVLEVAIIKDRRTGHQQGCCFVKYSSKDEADRAIRCLNNQRTLPGGTSPVQVRYADGERERLGAIEHKLFIGCLNKNASEREIEEVFSPYGRVDDVYVMRDEHKQSRGCAFVKYPSRDMAQAAIAALNNVYIMRGCDQPLVVRFADPKRPKTGDSRGSFSPRHQQSNSRSSGRASPVSWRQANALSLRQLHQAGPPSFPQTVISRLSPSQTASPAGTPAYSQGPYVQPQRVHSAGIPAEEFIQTAIQAFAGQQAAQQYPQLQQHPYHHQQQQQQRHIQLPPQQFNNPQPSQQPQFPQLQHLTAIQQQLQHQPQQHILHQPLQIPQQQQPPPVFQPGNNAQQPPWVPTSLQLIQSLVPTPALLPPTSNWTEHVSPEGYKYYYNSVTSESKWEKPEELLRVEQKVAPPLPADFNFSQFQSSLEQLRQQQVWI